MKLISCQGCGLIYDQDVVPFPIQIEDENGYIEGKCAWNGSKFVPIVTCVVCSDIIFKED